MITFFGKGHLFTTFSKVNQEMAKSLTALESTDGYSIMRKSTSEVEVKTK